jgi:hypothetical protein
VFEKWFAVILITLLPPLIPRHLLQVGEPAQRSGSPYKGGKQEKSSSLTFIRGGLGRGKKIFDTSIKTFQTSSYAKERAKALTTNPKKLYSLSWELR